MVKASAKIIQNVIIPLVLGTLIYISFRSTSLRMFNWFDIIGISDWINAIRNIFHPVKNNLPSWVYYSLPDALWVYSFSSLYLIIWGNHFTEGKYWLSIPLISGCLVELAQGLKLFKGTFDPIDLILCLLAFILSIIILKPIQKNEKQKEVF